LERLAKVSVGILLSATLTVAGTARAAISITSIGFWAETIDATDLAAGPGSDLEDTYESAADQVSLDISGATGDSDAWRVDVRRVDSAWHADLHLHVQRTSDGSGGGSISGGSSYQEIGESYQSFFSGSGDRNQIDLRLKITGVSVQVPAAAYSSAVYYTVVDN
jgi:hypothetical protein